MPVMVKLVPLINAPFEGAVIRDVGARRSAVTGTLVTGSGPHAGDELRDEFEQERSITADLLCYADMTTGPDGQPLTVGTRLAEIRTRYGPDDVVTRFWEKAEPRL